MKSGLYFNANSQQSVADVVALGKQVEQLGFDTLLIAEPLFSQQSSAQIIASYIEAMAANTEEIQIGCADRVIALDEPVTLAKQFLSLQNHAAERFIGGVAVGEDAEIFLAHCVPFERCRDIFSEILGTLPQLLANNPIEHRGRHFEFSAGRPFSGNVNPPAVWVCARDYPTQSNAAKHSYPILPYLLSEHRVIKDQYREYDEMLAREGLAPDQIERPLARDIFVAGSKSEAFNVALEAYVALYRRHAECGELLDAKNQPKMAEACTPQALLSDHLIIGDSKSVAEQLDQLTQLSGCSQIFARMSVPGISSRASFESMRLFTEQVIPLLREHRRHA
ncbi:MAG: LLM class flavin-dependent oxidoreductase [Gammaproteobacteria bacterium]